MDPFSLILLVIGVVLQLAGTLMDQARSSQQQKRETGMRGTAVAGGKVPRYFLVGTVGEAGKFEYPNEWGATGGAPNAYAVDVYSFGDLPITGLLKLYVNGVSAAVSSSGHVTQGYPVTGDKSGYLWSEFFDGTQTTASSYLLSKFGADADRPWLSDMVGKGVPYIILTFLQDENIWAGFPKFVAELQGIKLYDPRQDTTAGGSGSQRWNDQSTWAFSDNNMVIIYNIERGIYYDGEHVWGGTASAAQMPYDAWAAAMDACDLSINLEAGGTEKQFRGGRKISFNERPADVIKEFLVGANSRIVHCSDGTIYPLVGVPSEADGAFTDDDIIATNKLGTIPFPNLDSVISGGTGTFRAPQQAWEDKETSPYYRSDLEAKDDGRQQIEGLDLGTTFSGTQAQRVIQATVEESRRFRRHVVAFPPEFAVYRPLQALAWTSTRFDYTAKLFLITVRTRDPFGNVVFGLQEIDPADHAWVPGTDERAITYAPVVTNRPAPQEVSGFSVAPAIVQDSNGANRRPGIDVFWSAVSVAVDVAAVRVTIALDDGAGGPDATAWEGSAPRPELGSARVTQGLLKNEDYVVQIQYIAGSGRVTVESSWLPVTTPNIGLTDTDLAQFLQDKLDYADQTLRSLQERIDDLDQTQASQASWNRDVYVKQGSNLAAVVRQTDVILEETSGLASDITAANVRIGNVDASGLFGTTATVDEGAGEVLIQMAARVASGDTIVTSGLGVGVADGIGYIYLDADKTIFTGTMYFGDYGTINTDTGGFDFTVPD